MPFIAPSLKIKRYENETKDVISQKSKSKKSEPPKERRKKRIKSYKKPSPVPTKNAKKVPQPPKSLFKSEVEENFSL